MVTFISSRTLSHISYNFIATLIHKFPRCYLGCTVLLALSGYALVLLFPLLVLTGLVYILDELAVNGIANLQSILIWLAVVFAAALVSYRITQIKFRAPAGLTLSEDKAPAVFTLVQKHCNYFKRPKIHRIVITGDYELDIIKTPVWVLPVWSTNTLVIGLPVLQSLSPKQFECMVARRIGQFSKRYNPITNWLYQLRAIWQQYRDIDSRQTGSGIEPLKWCFCFYAPFYSAVSRYAARLDELRADTYAMELFNDEEVLDMITADALCRWYLHNQFWPAVYKIASIENKILPAPHTKMASAVYAVTSEEKLDILVVRVYKEKPRSRDAIPSLQQRIENIGHDKPRMKPHTSENAAMLYLGASAKGVIAVIDKLWLKSLLAQRKQQRLHTQQNAAPEQVTST